MIVRSGSKMLVKRTNKPMPGCTALAAVCLLWGWLGDSGDGTAARLDQTDRVIEQETVRPRKQTSRAPKRVPKTGEAAPKRKPTLLPAAQRRNRSSIPPPLTREEPRAPQKQRRAIVPAPLPYARDVRGDRGPPLGVPAQYDPLMRPATPPIGWPPLPPARQVPGESGIPLGPSPLSPVR